MQAWTGRTLRRRLAAANGAKFKMKCEDRHANRNKCRQFNKEQFEGNLHRPTGHAAEKMINDSRDRWHIRLLIFQCIKRIRSLSSKQGVNEIIQQQWANSLHYLKCISCRGRLLIELETAAEIKFPRTAPRQGSSRKRFKNKLKRICKHLLNVSEST